MFDQGRTIQRRKQAALCIDHPAQASAICASDLPHHAAAVDVEGWESTASGKHCNLSQCAALHVPMNVLVVRWRMPAGYPSQVTELLSAGCLAINSSVNGDCQLGREKGTRLMRELAASGRLPASSASHLMKMTRGASSRPHAASTGCSRQGPERGNCLAFRAKAA